MVVHHKNEDHKDNRLSNLQRLCRSCHISVHRQKLIEGKNKTICLQK
jgi:5-methylcytosine-specific restriction endonuclease McrA